MNDFLIYMHTSPSGKSYIGQTNNYIKRCRAHRNRNGACRAFSSAINKYGWDNFKHEILKEGLSLDEANYWESEYIEKYKTVYPDGYNLNSGGLNKIPSSDTRDLWSKQRTGKKSTQETKDKLSNKFKGRVLSDEWRAKISASLKSSKKAKEARFNLIAFNTGRKMTEECRAKISASLTGRKQSNETKEKRNKALTGMKRTEETKKRISEAKKGCVIKIDQRIKISETLKKTYIIISPDGERNIIIGIHDYCKKNNLNTGNMVQVAKGNSKHHKGYRCEYFYSK